MANLWPSLWGEEDLVIITLSRGKEMFYSQQLLKITRPSTGAGWKRAVSRLELQGEPGSWIEVPVPVLGSSAMGIHSSEICADRLRASVMAVYRDMTFMGAVGVHTWEL